ncbi:hypothetical protein C8F01DRAFT_1261524 [Mycena amicta]|nr:hypothetical protein C8F01DRAFT_1261524 [Mycena amicta]
MSKQIASGPLRDESTMENTPGHVQCVPLHLSPSGIVAVYPEAQFGPWKNGNESIRAWQDAPYSPPGVDDARRHNHLPDNLCLDSNRFHASGKSNGAASPTCSHARQPLRYLCACLTCTLRRCQPYQLRTILDRIIPFGGQDADKEGRKEYATPNITQFRKAWATAKVGGIVKLSSAIELKNLLTTTLDMAPERPVQYTADVLGLDDEGTAPVLAPGNDIS